MLGEAENLGEGDDGVVLADARAGRGTTCCARAVEPAPSAGTLTVTAGGSRTRRPVLRGDGRGGSLPLLPRSGTPTIWSAAPTAFVAAIKSGDVERAKQLFATTREPYEAIEPVAESFGDLDPAIDARINDVDGRLHDVDRLPPASSRSLWERASIDARARRRSLTSCVDGHRRAAAEGRRRVEFAAGPARERRDRAARRGRQVEDHRRGGPLLPHRPVGLPGEPRRLARGASTRCSPSLDRVAIPELAATIKSALRRRPARRSTATGRGRGFVALHGAHDGRHARGSARRSTRSPSRSPRHPASS